MLKTSPNRYCTNCYYPLPRFGEYCSHCRQKYKPGKVTFWELVREFFSGVLNFENRMWKTAAGIFVPGRLTKAFLKGRRERYVSPLRFFFITAILFFAIVNFFGGKVLSASLEESIKEDEQDNYHSYYMDELRHLSDTLKLELTDDQSVAAVDSLYKRMSRGVEDSTTLFLNLELFDVSMDEMNLSRKDLALLSTDSLMSTYAGDKTYVQRLIMRQNIRLQRSGEEYIGFLLSQAVWMMLVLMPFLGLVLKLIYVRRGWYYVDHLIFSFHLHAFIFVWMSAAIVITQSGMLDFLGPEQAENMASNLWSLALLWIPIYFFVSLRRVYQQSRRKTFLKFLLLTFSYIFMFSAAAIITFVVTALAY